MTKKLRIIKKLLILLESEVGKTSGSLSQDKTSLEKRQPGTTWVSSPGHWGAKNAAGNVKYFTTVDSARDYSEGGTGETGVDTQPDDAGAKKQTTALVNPDNLWDAGEGYWAAKNAKGVVKYFTDKLMATYHAAGYVTNGGTLLAPQGAKKTAPPAATPPTASTASTTDVEKQKKPGTAWPVGQDYWGGKNAKGEVKYFTASPKYTASEAAWDFAEGENDGSTGVATLPKQTPPAATTPPTTPTPSTDADSHEPNTVWGADEYYWGGKNAKGEVKYFSLQGQAELFAQGAIKGIYGLDKLPGETPADTTAPTASAPTTATDADSHEPETMWDTGEGWWGGKNAEGVVKYFQNPIAAQWYIAGSDIQGYSVDNPPEPGVAKRKPKTFWDTGTGFWGAKNGQEVVKYFDESLDSTIFTAKERAEDFANGLTAGKTGVDSLPPSAKSTAPSPPTPTPATTASLPMSATSGADKQPETIWNVPGTDFWGAKNAQGEVKYFTSGQNTIYTGDELAYNFADGYTWPIPYGIDAPPVAPPVAKPAVPAVSVAQRSQIKYVADISGFVAKNNTLTFGTYDDVSEYSIGDIPFDYKSINPDFETEYYYYNALTLPNGKHIEMFPLLQTEGQRQPEEDPEAKSKDELQGKRYSAGVIIEEEDGRIWILKPRNGFGGYDYTFPKGGINQDVLDDWDGTDSDDKKIELRTAAVREAFEETGLLVQIVDYLGDMERSTSHNRYFIAKRVGGSPIKFDSAETEKTLLMHPGEALKSLNSPYDAKLMAMYAEYRKNNPKEIKIGSLYDEPVDVDFSHIYGHTLGATSESARAKLGTQKPGTQAGSNPGGLYIGVDGKERYVKMYSNRSQAAGEHLANVIYNCLGISAASSGLIATNTTTTYYSDIIPDVKTLQQVGLNKERARNILKGFAADILTANWDTVGLANDNIVFEKNSDVPIRIDNGGTFLVRAQGAPKTSIPGYTEDSLDDIKEYDTFLNPSINANYARVFAASGYTKEEFDNEVKKQVQHLLKVTSFFGGWTPFIEQVFGNTSGSVSFTDQQRFAQMLNARTLKLAKRFGLLADMDVESEHKTVINLNYTYEVRDATNTRYDLSRHMDPAGNDDPHLTLGKTHSNLVVVDRPVQKSVAAWKSDALWQKPIRERYDILKNISNFFRHTNEDSLQLDAPLVQRGMAFADEQALKLFLRNFRKGKSLSLLPSGFTTNLDVVHSFANLNYANITSVILRTRPAVDNKLVGLHIAQVPTVGSSYPTHEGEREIILSDRHGYVIVDIYRQPFMINNQLQKTVYIIELEQKSLSSINEAVKLEENDTDDKIAKYVLDMCMMGNVRTKMPTEQDFRKMLKK